MLIIKVSSSSNLRVAITYDANNMSSSFMRLGRWQPMLCDNRPLLVWSVKQINVFKLVNREQHTIQNAYQTVYYAFVCLFLFFQNFLVFFISWIPPKVFPGRQHVKSKGWKRYVVVLTKSTHLRPKLQDYRSYNNLTLQTATDNQSLAATYCPIFVIANLSSTFAFQIVLIQ